MTSCWSHILTFYQYLGRIYEESWSGKITGSIPPVWSYCCPFFPFCFFNLDHGQGVQQLDEGWRGQAESNWRDCSDASQCKVSSPIHNFPSSMSCQLISNFLTHLLISLLLDDIEDSSILRRGLPVAHKIFGEVIFSVTLIIFDIKHMSRLAQSTVQTMWCSSALKEPWLLAILRLWMFSHNSFWSYTGAR